LLERRSEGGKIIKMSSPSFEKLKKRRHILMPPVASTQNVEKFFG
jgi:hypothetical protein